MTGKAHCGEQPDRDGAVAAARSASEEGLGLPVAGTVGAYHAAGALATFGSRALLGSALVAALIGAFVMLAGGVSSAEAQDDSCPNAEFRTGPSAQLPDCRAYEQVSPSEKFGYPVGGKDSPGLDLHVAERGDRVSYGTFFPLSAAAKAGSYGGFAAERFGSGWLTEGLLPTPGPNQVGNGLPANDSVLLGATPDQRTFVYYNNTTEPFGSLWVLRSDGSRVRIADSIVLGDSSSRNDGQPFFEGISANGRHVVFSSTARLGPAAGLPGSDRILYEWADDGASGGAGSLRVINRENGDPLTLLASAHAALGGGGSDPVSRIIVTFGRRHAISADGTRIFFQTPAADSPAGGGGPLYLRVDGAQTTELSAPEPGYTPTSPPSAEGVKFLEASVDGAVAYFYADGDLTTEAPASGGIYRYDIESSELTWIDSAGGGVPTAVASADGEVLYYQRGPDLYRYANDSTTEVLADFIIGLGTAGGKPPTGVNARTGISTGDCVSADISANGRFLAFGGEPSGGPRATVYRYDAASGEPPLEMTKQAREAGLDSAFNLGCGPQFAWQGVSKRVMSDDGRFVFFDTIASLAAADTNGQFDTYRWDATDQSIELISPGQGSYSFFAGTDATGANAFFMTAQALTAGDGDTVWDLYSARVNGGFPAPPDPPSCRGEACQGELSGAPAPNRLGSAAFRGAGNPRSADQADRCKKLGRKARSGRKQAKRKLRRLSRSERKLSRKLKRAKRKHGAGGRSANRRLRRVERQRRRATQAKKRAKRLAKRARRCGERGGRS